VLSPVVTIVPFLANVYADDTGALILIFDILRLVFILLMFIFTFQSIVDAKRKLHDTEKNVTGYMKIFFQPKIITTIIIMLLYIILFATKALYLKMDSDEIWPQSSSNGFLRSVNKEFYSTVNNFELAIVLETLIIFSLFARMILFFYDYTRIFGFFIYIYNSFKRVASFFMMLIFFLLSFAVFANNLWGQYFDAYRDIASSITNVLLFSIGHFQTQIYGYNYRWWNIIFTFLFFLIFIYFSLTTFVGIFLESYRITSTEIGYSYEYRKKDEQAVKKKNK
jgi:hypothetical protein